MTLEQVLKEREISELQAFYSFWNGDGVAPGTVDRVVAELVDRMTDEALVGKRLHLLSKKLLEILKFFLRSEGYATTLEHILHSRTFSYMNPYEMEAALNALQKRGFIFRVMPARGKAEKAPRFRIPEELAEILRDFLWDEEKDIHDTFSLKGYLSRFPEEEIPLRFGPLLSTPPGKGTGTGAVLRKFLHREEVLHRIQALDDPDLAVVVRRAAMEFGGFLPRGLYARLRGKLPPWKRRQWKQKLESHLLGSVRHLALGEYGINHFDETLVLFHEVVEAVLDAFGTVDAAQLMEIRSLGVDLISDISNFLSFISHNKIRLTLNGSIYRTAMKKAMDGLILCGKEGFDPQEIFQFIYFFCLGDRLIQRRGDRNLTLTVKGKAWDRQSLERKLSRLMAFVFDELQPGEEPFHLPHLKKLVVEYLKNLEMNRWVDVMVLPFKARNRYLADLDKNSIRDAFQNRFQYSQNTTLRDTVQLANSLLQWIQDRFYLLGLVDLGFKEGKVAALRLNPLGAKALGMEVDESVLAGESCLIVNPDFEVILFQEGDRYDLITRLDKFAVRTKSDHAYHFKITAASVEKAVAEGMRPAEILEILSENSRVGVPQNVIYSIKEWAEKVKFVELRPALLLRGRSKEVIDRIVQDEALQAVVVERLSPTVITVDPGVDRKTLAELLQRNGVFLEGSGDGAPGKEA